MNLMYKNPPAASLALLRPKTCHYTGTILHPCPWVLQIVRLHIDFVTVNNIATAS